MVKEGLSFTHTLTWIPLQKRGFALIATVKAMTRTTLDKRRPTMNSLTDNELALIAAFVVVWFFGYVVGKWWERMKWEPPKPDNDEMWW